MRQRPGQSRHWTEGRGQHRPVTTAGQATGKDAGILGEIEYGHRARAQVFQRRRRHKRRQHNALVLLAIAQRGNVRAAIGRQRGDDRFADHGQTLIRIGGSIRLISTTLLVL